VGELRRGRHSSKLLDGVDGMHSVGVIHRNIKPSNIMLDANGEPRLVDFDLAVRCDP
jgi:serine/threonine protein kinase